MRPIYFDYHATTPVDRRVVQAMAVSMLEDFGNPQSREHVFGERARQAVEVAADHVAELVGGRPERVVFTSGASEGIRIAVEHAVAQRRRDVAKVVASPTEHRAVLDAINAEVRKGTAQVAWLRVDSVGRVDLEGLTRLADGADLVCVMSANNEIGTVEQTSVIAGIVHGAGSAYLVDSTQSAGRENLRLPGEGTTYIALSGHKLYGPKGSGALVVAGSGAIPRPPRGTPNVPGIVGLGEACRLRLQEMATDEPRIRSQRDRLAKLLRAGIEEMTVNGSQDAHLAGNLHFSVPGVPNDAVVARLRHQVALSTGAACSSGAGEESHVLKAIGMPVELREGSLRIGIGKFTTDPEIETGASFIVEAVREVRRTRCSDRTGTVIGVSRDVRGQRR